MNPMLTAPRSDREEWRLRLHEWSSMGTQVYDDQPSGGDGLVDVTFGTGEHDYDDLSPPTAEQMAHVDWLVEHHGGLMRDAVLEAALRLYKAHRMDMVDPEEEDDDLPLRSDASEMTAFVLPTQIHLTSIPGLDVPYVGLRLSCSWDSEHDLGILCRGMEIVSVTGDQHIDAFSAAGIELEPGTGTMLDEQGCEIS